MNFSVVAEPPNYDCHASTTFALIHPVAPHYSTLLKFDGANYPAVKGDLAKEWKASSDGLSYTFTLHQPVKFHDGSPLTSADIKASFDRIANPSTGVISARRSFWTDLDRIETPDPATVVFKLKAPLAGMLELFANPYNCIYSAKKLAENPEISRERDHGIGRVPVRAARQGQSLGRQAVRGLLREGPAVP